jgi:hypothetical protein
MLKGEAADDGAILCGRVGIAAYFRIVYENLGQIAARIAANRRPIGEPITFEIECNGGPALGKALTGRAGSFIHVIHRGVPLSG